MKYITSNICKILIIVCRVVLFLSLERLVQYILYYYQVTWLVDGEEVDEEYFETQNVREKFTLSLPKVVLEDEAEYTVIAENQHGTVSTTASVTVVKGRYSANYFLKAVIGYEIIKQSYLITILNIIKHVPQGALPPRM